MCVFVFVLFVCVTLTAVCFSDSTSIKVDQIYMPRENMSLPSNMQLNDLSTLRKGTVLLKGFYYPEPISRNPRPQNIFPKFKDLQFLLSVFLNSQTSIDPYTLLLKLRYPYTPLLRPPDPALTEVFRVIRNLKALTLFVVSL